VGILSGGVIARDLNLNEVYGGNLDEVEVTVSGVDPKEFVPARHGAEHISIGSDVTVLKCKGGDNLPPLIAEVYRNHGKVVEVKPRKMDLEDIFVREISDRADRRTEEEKKKSDEMAFTK
jgi:hypothetical protein